MLQVVAELPNCPPGFWHGTCILPVVLWPADVEYAPLLAQVDPAGGIVKLAHVS